MSAVASAKAEARSYILHRHGLGACLAFRTGSSPSAAAELDAGMPTFPDQVPNPDTAPTVSQEQLRSLAASGKLAAVIAGSVEADQASLNMQWRLVAISQTAGVCQDLGAGQSLAVPVGVAVTMIPISRGGIWSVLGFGPGAVVELQYASSSAVRRRGRRRLADRPLSEAGPDASFRHFQSRRSVAPRPQC